MDSHDAPLLDEHVVVGGHRIAAGSLGDRRGEPAVLLHGTPTHSFMWRRVAPNLAAAGIDVYLFDLLGYGASERPVSGDTSVTGQEAVLLALMDHWGLDSAHLVGHDIGGAIALRTVARAPERVRTLTALDTVSYDSWPSETWAAVRNAMLATPETVTDEQFEQMMAGQLLTAVHDESLMVGDVLASYVAPLIGRTGRASYVQHQLAHYDSRHTEEITSALAEIDRPVHLIWGEQDRWQPISWAHRLMRDIPDATLTSIPEAGHFVTEDAPDAVSHALLRGLGQPDTAL